MKKTFYFTHDFNARNDEKILRLRMKHGMLGYGVYFALIEKLGEATDYVSIVDYNIIAYDLRVDASVVKSVINDFGLFAFTGDGECFYSESLIARMKPLESLYDNRKKAGMKSAEKRWNKSYVENENGENGEKTTVSEHPDNQRLHNTVITPLQHRYNTVITPLQHRCNKENKENKENNINNSSESSNEDSLSDCKQSDPLFSTENQSRESNGQSERIDYEKLVSWFNEKTKGCFGTIRLPLSEQRKGMLRARFAEHGKGSFVEVVENALNSDFLRGQNNRGWKATFDWLIKPTNYEKVLSKNYKNAENGQNRKNCSDEELLDAIAQGYARAEYNKAKREGRITD